MPVNELSESFIVSNDTIDPIEDGIVPLMLSKLNSNVCTFFKYPISVGSVPVKEALFMLILMTLP